MNEIKERTVYQSVRTDKPNDGTDIYVGSTSQPLKKRLVCHRSHAKICNSKLYTRMDEVGKYNWKIIPLLTYPCDKKTICEFEKEWIKVLDADLNTFSPLDENHNVNKNELAKKHYHDSLVNGRYSCNVCDMIFGKLDHLKRHFKSLKHKEKVKSFEFEQLLTNVHEMIKNGTFSQALENSRETDI